MASNTERVKVRLPDGFDPSKHEKALAKKIADAYGDGFEIDSLEDGYAIASRTVTITEVSNDATGKVKEVRLPRSVKPSDGDKMAVKYADQHGDNWEMTKFEPYLHRATLTQLTPEVARCRGASAMALGVKPWEVQVKQRLDGGFDLELPKSYMPSKHDAKLEEVATGVVGYEGWYVKVNAQKLTASIIPSDPPTFAAAYPYPFSAKVPKFALNTTDWAKIPMGMKLPARGEETGEVFSLDLIAGSHLQIGGISGGGKASTLDTPHPVPVSDRFPRGWALNRELTLGDELFAPDGTVTKVVGFSSVTREPVYEVEFSDGQVARVGASHLWKVSTEVTRRAWRTRSTARRAAHFEDFQARAAGLRNLASTLPVGTVGSLLDISRLAGLHENSLTQMHLPVKHLATEAMMPTSKKSRLYNVDVLAESLQSTPAVFRKRPLTRDLLEGKSLLGKSLTAREITSGVLGAPAERVDRAAMSKLLRTRKIPFEMGVASLLKKVYPADEVLGLIADRIEAQSYTSDSGKAAIDLETVLSTREMAESFLFRQGSRETSNYAVRLARPVEGPAADLPVDPYVLGAWLGDGSRWHPAGITSADEEIVHGIVAAGYPLRRSEAIGSANRSRTYYFDGLREALARAGLKADANRRQPAEKHIPTAYLRSSVDQRLALLQGLMDTDGTISATGSCEIDLCDQRLADGVLELIRSLGIRVSQRARTAAITEEDPENPGRTRQRETGLRYRMKFTTGHPVFRLQRKAARIPSQLRPTQQWNYIKDIRVVDEAEMRCIAVDHPEHLYLSDGFISTHNTVLINAYIAGWLARGAELVVVDLPSKSVDFLWCKDFVRDGGWGCDNLKSSVTALSLVMAEGDRRAKIIGQYGVQKWTELPPSVDMKPIVVVVDELTGLFFPEKVPKLAKDHPLVVEANEINLQKALLEKFIKRIAAELRFTGVHLLVASQVASVATGIDPAMRTNLHHKILMGAKPTEGNRRLVLSDPGRVPAVPDNVKADGKASRGSGVAEPEGDEPCVFKSFFATAEDYANWLRGRGVRISSRPAPTSAEIARHTPSLEDEPDATAARRAAMPDPGAHLYGEAGYDENGRPLKGAALAAAQSRALAGHGGRA